MRISYWSSDVCSSDLFTIKTYDEEGNASVPVELIGKTFGDLYQESLSNRRIDDSDFEAPAHLTILWAGADIANYAYARSEEHTSELQSLMRISYAVFCLNKIKVALAIIFSNGTPINTPYKVHNI